MARIKAPHYLSWRNGRPRWNPGPGLRALGWRGQDLKDEGDQWLNLEGAMKAAAALNRQVDKWRKSGGRPFNQVRKIRPGRTVEDLIDLYKLSHRFKQLKPATQRDYAAKLKVVSNWCGDSPAARLRAPILHRFYEVLYEERGHAMANAVLAMTRIILSHARRIGWRADNPAERMGLRSTKPRVCVWEPEECKQFVQTADRAGEHGIADAFMFALHTSQRQGDLLRLPRLIFASDRIAFSQSKRGARVDVKYTPTLKVRVEQTLERRRANGWDNIETMLVDDVTRRPFNSNTFRHRFRALRETLADKHPSLAKKRFQDLRDTALTRLALVDLETKGTVDMFAIAAISGHSPAHITSVLKHYVQIRREMADRGIDALSEWLAKNKIEF